MSWGFRNGGRSRSRSGWRAHTYVVVDGSLALRNHIGVRDVLRADAALREEYAAVKKRIGVATSDIEEYGRGKNAVVQRILAAASLTQAERASIDSIQVPSHEDVPR